MGRGGILGRCVAAVIVAGSLGLVVPPTTAGAAGIVAVPTSIPANCSRDVTADLLAWIKSVPNGSTLTFTPNGCYRVDRPLLIRDRTGLTFEGNHATFRAFTDGTELGSAIDARNRAMWEIAGGRAMTIRNTVVVGANPYAGRGDRAYRAAFEAQHAYLIQNTHGMLLDHVEAYDVYGDFVYVGTNSSDVTVQNSTFLRNGRQGWTINGTNVLFQRNVIGETRRATIDMEPARSTWVARNVTIRDNTVGKGRLYFFASVGAAATIDNVTIAGNHLVGKDLSIYVDPPKGTRSNYHVIDNASDTVTSKQNGAAFGFRDIVNLEVRGNVQPVQAGRGISGVSIRNCAHVSVTGNTFRRAKGPVLDLGKNVDVRQSGNRVGNPLVTAPATVVAGPTPVPAR